MATMAPADAADRCTLHFDSKLIDLHLLYTGISGSYALSGRGMLETHLVLEQDVCSTKGGDAITFATVTV